MPAHACLFWYSTVTPHSRNNLKWGLTLGLTVEEFREGAEYANLWAEPRSGLAEPLQEWIEASPGGKGGGGEGLVQWSPCKVPTLEYRGEGSRV